MIHNWLMWLDTPAADGLFSLLFGASVVYVLYLLWTWKEDP